MMKSTVAIVAIVASSMSGASAFTGAALSARNALGAPQSVCGATRPGLMQRAQVSTAGSQRGSGVLQLRSQEQGSGSRSADLPAKALLWTTWVVYMQQIFFSDQPCGAQATGDLCGIGMPTIMEAINLSINFWFVTPIVFPSMAPVVHPALEGLFNFVIAFGALFVGFLSDGRGQKVPMLPFMVGTAFLTNVFYLPYLGLRRPLDDAVAALDQPAGEGQEVSANEISLAESKGLPLAMLAVFAGSVLWACFGRGAEFGDVSTRMTALVDMVLHSDRLAHSFMVDSLVFWGFQGWLVPDDMRRRGWDNTGADVIARAVPFFGLIYYLLARPPLPDQASNQ